tara:strand:- start:7852 stop:9102 length:1251 start_codon:yes stop_codon:yes gene_type:complete
MKIEKIHYDQSNDQHALSFSVIANDGEYPVWIKSPVPLMQPEAAGNALLCATLVPAMSVNQTLEIPPPVDQRLIDTSATIAEIYQTWYSDFSLPKCNLDAESLEKKKANTNVGLFFSGGIDSFYTLLRKRDSITHLIYVHGFDIPLGDHVRRQKMSESLNAIANDLGLKLLEVETNLREFSDIFCLWGQHYFGCGLAMIAHLLSPSISTVYISCDTTYLMLEPWGSHPLVTPLWSTSNSEQIFFGANASRLEKTRFIGDNAITTKHLHVCWEHRSSSTNCGECEKCVRTMAMLFVTGNLTSYSCFPHTLTADLVRNIELDNLLTLPFWQDILDSSGAYPDIHDAVEYILGRYRSKTVVKMIRDDPIIVERIFGDGRLKKYIVDTVLTNMSLRSIIRIVLIKFRRKLGRIIVSPRVR